MPDYQKKTVAELTEILKARSLPHSGKKADLIARLNEADKAAEPANAEPEVTKDAPDPAPVAPEVTADPEPSMPTTDATTTIPAADTTSLAPHQPAPTSREGSATTDAKLATAVDYSMGLTTSSVDEELKKRKARAERFGTGAATESSTATATETDAEALRTLERAKRFGTGQTSDGNGVGKLDEALPMDRERKGKRGREEGAYDDPGLKQGRGGKRRFPGRGGRNDSRRGERPEGVKKQTGLNDKDRTAAEARRKRFAAAA